MSTIQPDSLTFCCKAAETGASATEPTASPTKTDDGDDDGDDGGDLNTAKPTKDSGKSTKTKSDEKKSTSISIPPDAAVGGVSITEPATSAEPTVLFKIGDNVTLGWNYTGLVVTPTAVDVLISCSTASETWTLTNNMTFATDVSYVWNSQEQADDVESPLLTEMYTLIIKDSEAEVSEFPSAGMLGANAEFTFGLYHKQAYTPWPEWQCVGCNSATSAHDTQAIKLATIMSIITVFTFTWFVTGWGIH